MRLVSILLQWELWHRAQSANAVLLQGRRSWLELTTGFGAVVENSADQGLGWPAAWRIFACPGDRSMPQVNLVSVGTTRRPPPSGLKDLLEAAVVRSLEPEQKLLEQKLLPQTL